MPDLIIAATAELAGLTVLHCDKDFDLAGDFLYQHWTPFHDVANDVGHATVRAVDDVGHATVRAADDVGHAASSAWHSVTSLGGLI